MRSFLNPQERLMLVRMNFGTRVGQTVDVQRASALAMLNDGRADRVDLNNPEEDSATPETAMHPASSDVASVATANSDQSRGAESTDPLTASGEAGGRARVKRPRKS